jgi:ABC-type glycerol-3-phosphate transport system permease component
MPLLSPIGRRHPRTRILIAGLYLLLLGGALTMLYPFGVLIAGSTGSAVDTPARGLIPEFLIDDAALYRKHMEALFNEQLDALRMTYDLDVPSFAAVEPPPAGGAAGLVDAWAAFLGEADPVAGAWMLGHLRAPVSRTLPLMHRRFKRELIRSVRGDVSALNRALGMQFVNWNAFDVVPVNPLARHVAADRGPWGAAVEAFQRRQPAGYQFLVPLEGYYKALFLKTQYSRDIETYNRLHGTDYPSYDAIRLSRRAPAGNERERADWELFVRRTLQPGAVRLDAEAAPAYRDYLRARYGSIERLNQRYGAAFDSFEQALWPVGGWAGGAATADWELYLAGWEDPGSGARHQASVDHLSLAGVEFDFQDYLRRAFGDIRTLNERWGTAFASFDEIRPPQREAHYRWFQSARGALRREFSVRNFATVLDFMLLHGRGVVNTVIYCLLAVLAALLVNPLAAYALSRYRLPSTYKILLLMLVVMAFPPMVTQIPVFLMMRDLNLLNTFAALVLPGLAHGYSIFLLKGFFDSLPRDLYENAQMDGAGEWTLFWTITMSLSKPILAVVALQAFVAAYSNFMFALLICQDEKMWTLMVWLYQLQQRSGPSVMYASLLLAALPTFLVFAFCQNVIMRGIVVPVEK